MTRPTEYENLIKTRALEAVQSTPGAVHVYLQNAADYLAAAMQTNERLTLQIFTAAYEGYFQIVAAFLEFHQVRAKDAGRNLVIQRVSSDLKLSPAEFAFVTKAHARRNDTAYHSPFPPISKAEAQALVSVLEKYLPIARAMLA